MRKIISLLLRIGISVGILLFLFRQVDFNKIIQAVGNINKPILIFVFLLTLLSYVFGFFRWKILLIGLGVNLTHSLIFKSFCIGFFSNLFFPSTIGGDLCRTVDLGLRSKKPRQVVASVILDRLGGYSALVVIALLAFMFAYKIITEVAVFFSLGITSIFLVGILVILFNNFVFSKVRRLLHFLGRIGETLSNLHYEIYNFRSQKRIILKNFCYSLVIQLIIPFSYYLLSLALGERISPIYFFVLVPIISVVSALPISIAGLGLREASSVYLFTRVGMSGETALVISLLSFFIIFLLGLTGGLIYVFTFSHRRL